MPGIARYMTPCPCGQTDMAGNLIYVSGKMADGSHRVGCGLCGLMAYGRTRAKALKQWRSWVTKIPEMAETFRKAVVK